MTRLTESTLAVRAGTSPDALRRRSASGCARSASAGCARSGTPGLLFERRLADLDDEMTALAQLCVDITDVLDELPPVRRDDPASDGRPACLTDSDTAEGR